jgi:condensin complex subunit 3
MAPRLALDNLQDSISVIFDQGQASAANHRKNCVALHKIHAQACAITQSIGKSLKLVGERVFGDVFIDMINRVVVVKKGSPAADRTVKFIGFYVRFINEKGAYRSDYAFRLNSQADPTLAPHLLSRGLFENCKKLYQT